VTPAERNGSTRRRPCPTASKMSFPTREEASAFNKRAHAAGRAKLRVYRCTCSRWHLTHLTKREHKAIVRAA
jgi:hypothetical protein